MPRLLQDILNIIFSLIILALVGVALLRPDLVEGIISYLGHEIQTLGTWNYLIAFLASMLESFPVIGALLPGQQVMLLVGGFYGRDHIVGVLALSVVGACLGNAAGYFLGKYMGLAFFETYGQSFGIGRTELRYLHGSIEKNGAWFVILGKFHNLTRSFVPFIAGSMGMASARFWVYNILGSVLWATTIIGIGIVFSENYKTILDYIQYIVLGIFIAFIGYVYFFRKDAFLKYVQEKSDELDERTAPKPTTR